MRLSRRTFFRRCLGLAAGAAAGVAVVPAIAKPEPGPLPSAINRGMREIISAYDLTLSRRTNETSGRARPCLTPPRLPNFIREVVRNA